MSSATNLPKACAKPCNDCPWRRVSAAGWTGPMPASDWIKLAMSDEPIACHTTIDADENGEGDWSNPRMRQCKGAAIFRRNNGKLPRNWSDAAAEAERDTVTIFASREEFLAHHARSEGLPRKKKPAPPRPVVERPKLDDPCDSCEGNEAEWSCSNCGNFHACNPCIDGFIDSKCPMCMVDAWVPLDDEDDPFDYDGDEW